MNELKGAGLVEELLAGAPVAALVGFVEHLHDPIESPRVVPPYARRKLPT